MRTPTCDMCDTHEPNRANPHGWCDKCEEEFAGVLKKLACECGTCITPVTCTMLKRCAAVAPIPNKLYAVK